MLDVFVFQFVVGQVSGQILVVSGHIYEAVSGQVEQDDFFFPALLARLGFVDGGSDGMTGFRCRNDAFGLGEQAARVEGFQLLDVGGLHQSVFQELGDDDARAVVTQSACMDVGRSEVVSQGEHRQEGSVARFVSEVVLEMSARQFWARCRFGCDVTCLFPFLDAMAHERETDAAEVGTAAETADDDVRIFTGHFHLFLGFQAMMV